MFKRTIAAALATVLTLSAVLPVYADNYTGWSTENDQAVYYVNGIQAKNVWVKYGNTCYFIGGDGHIVPNAVVDASAAASYGITNYLDSNNNNLRYDIPIKQTEDVYSAAKYAYGVSDDFEAFKKLYPQYVYNFAGNDEGLWNYYMATYCGQTPDNKYLKALDGFVYGYYYNVHHYDYKYVSNGDGTHKAYCGCGEYKVEECNHDRKTSDRKGYACTYCGQHFKHKK